LNYLLLSQEKLVIAVARHKLLNICVFDFRGSRLPLPLDGGSQTQKVEVEKTWLEE
jgi:hypothetical protein